METLIGYLKMPTTWAGIITIVTSFGVTVSPELASAIGATGAATAGLLLVIFNENKSDDK
jgi:hypothetical protein